MSEDFSPPADDQAARSFEYLDSLVTWHAGAHAVTLDDLAVEQKRAKVLSGLLRGMARKLGAIRRIRDRVVADLIDERNRLRDDLADAHTSIRAFVRPGSLDIYTERDELRARLAAVRAVHERAYIVEDDGSQREVCTNCLTFDGEYVGWPCATAKEATDARAGRT